MHHPHPQANVHLEPDVITDGAAHQLLHLEHHPVQLDGPGLEHLLAAERQQLPGQIARAPIATDDLVQLVPDRVILGQLVAHDIDVQHDRHQEVVEVVRDAAREPPHRLVPLRVPELLLQSVALGERRLPLRHVAGEQADHLAVLDEQQGAQELDRRE